MKNVQWFRSYGAFFESPDWLLNMVSGMACMFIPIIGPIVYLGWLSDVVVSLHNRPNDPYPKFDWGRFGDYIGIGIVPFVVQLVAGIVVSGIIMAAYFAIAVLAGVIAGAAGPDAGPIVGVVVLVSFLVLILLSVLIQLPMLPMILAAALTGDASGD